MRDFGLPPKPAWGREPQTPVPFSSRGTRNNIPQEQTLALEMVIGCAAKRKTNAVQGRWPWWGPGQSPAFPLSLTLHGLFFAAILLTHLPAHRLPDPPSALAVTLVSPPPDESPPEAAPPPPVTAAPMPTPAPGKPRMVKAKEASPTVTAATPPQSVATTTAPPQEVPTAAPPSPVGEMPPSYLARVEELVKARMVYPPQALRRREQGIVRLLALIGADGGLLELTSETEATSSLTDAAMRAVRDAAPFPPLPPELRQTSARVTIPVAFSLK